MSYCYLYDKCSFYVNEKFNIFVLLIPNNINDLPHSQMLFVFATDSKHCNVVFYFTTTNDSR